MKDIQQLIKQDGYGETYEKIFPKTFLDAVKDKKTGLSLTDILSGFNMYFLSYTGSIESTRLQVPSYLRRTGLWITYVKYDKTVVTEWYAGDDISDEAWKLDSNWRIGSSMLAGDVTISSEGNWIVNGVDTEVKAQGEQGVTPLLRINDNKLQVSYTDGTSYVDVNDTPIYTKFRENENKLQQSTDLGNTWTDISDYIAAWFRWESEGPGGRDKIGKIQISRDKGKTWSDFSDYFYNGLYIKDYVGTVSELPSHAALGDIYGVGPTYASEDTGHTNPIYRLYVRTSSGWVDNGQFTSISAGITQEITDSEFTVPSNNAIRNKLCLQELGDSTQFPVSQKSVSNIFNVLAGEMDITNKLRTIQLDFSPLESQSPYATIDLTGKSWKDGYYVNERGGLQGNSDFKCLEDLLEIPTYNTANISYLNSVLKVPSTYVGALVLTFYDENKNFLLGKRVENILNGYSYVVIPYGAKYVNYNSFIDNSISTLEIYTLSKSIYKVIIDNFTSKNIIDFVNNEVAEINKSIREELNTYSLLNTNMLLQSIINQSITPIYATKEIKHTSFFQGNGLDDIGCLDRIFTNTMYVKPGSNISVSWNNKDYKITVEQRDSANVITKEKEWFTEDLELSLSPNTVLIIIGIAKVTDEVISAREISARKELEVKVVGNFPKVTGVPMAKLSTFDSDNIDNIKDLGIYVRNDISADIVGYVLYVDIIKGKLQQRRSSYLDSEGLLHLGDVRTFDENTNSWSSWRIIDGDIENNIISSETNISPSIIYSLQNPFNDESKLFFKDGAKRRFTQNIVPLIIIAGQSNADGRASYSTAPQWLKDSNYEIPDYMMWNEDSREFKTYNVLSNNGAGDISGDNNFSFDVFFAQRYIQKYGGTLYAIRQTVGGIGIQSQPTNIVPGYKTNYTWQPRINSIITGCNSMCLELLEKVKQAQIFAKHNNIRLLPIAILWHQGENDADNSFVDLYKQNLSNLISWMRGIFGAPSLPFINGYIQNNYNSAYAQINSIFNVMNEEDYFMRTVNMEGHYTSIGDGVHYDSPALEYMGEQMFEKFMQLNV